MLTWHIGETNKSTGKSSPEWWYLSPEKSPLCAQFQQNLLQVGKYINFSKHIHHIQKSKLELSQNSISGILHDHDFLINQDLV